MLNYDCKRRLASNPKILIGVYGSSLLLLGLSGFKTSIEANVCSIFWFCFQWVVEICLLCCKISVLQVIVLQNLSLLYLQNMALYSLHATCAALPNGIVKMKDLQWRVISCLASYGES